jgi:hypothetical protein
MGTRSKPPTPKQLQRLIQRCEKNIEQYAAKGFGDNVGLSAARTSLDTARQTLEAGSYDKARKGFDAAMDYLSTMATDAMEDFRRPRR